MKPPKTKGINPVLATAINDLLQQVMKDPDASLMDKTRVLDRALALEKIIQKISDDEWGAGFLPPEEE